MTRTAVERAIRDLAGPSNRGLRAILREIAAVGPAAVRAIGRRVALTGRKAEFEARCAEAQS